MRRLQAHPILPVPARESVPFRWYEQELTALEGETIAAALFAHGEEIFGWHPKDGSPQGLFCANGQCAQCLVVAGGLPVKACMTPVTPGLEVQPLNALPELPKHERPAKFRDTERLERPVLIIGGGPAGLSAAAELGRRGLKTLLIDDKDRLGGKLLLQTHRFFGSVEAVHAGTRGVDIANTLEQEVLKLPSVEVWLKSPALAVFSDGWVGILKHGTDYVLVRPQALLVAAGAREKALVFKGNTLPGVYGAGAFQTLLNRDLIRASEHLFIVGGGNVGLITGYHALQAGISVVGLVEALPDCGGYKVHRDKLARLGVPIHTSHTVLSANGGDHVESVTVAQVDASFRTIPGTEKTFACDTVLVAVGLEPVRELADKARAFGFNVFAAGDADEIAEASAAIFSGKIRGLEIAKFLGHESGEVPPGWRHTAAVLKSRPGQTRSELVLERDLGVYPVFHCAQEIPCNPCTSVCPQELIYIDPDDIRQVPVYLEGDRTCLACERCVRVCPGLAITLLDDRQDRTYPTVTVPYEFAPEDLQPGDRVTVLDTVGKRLGTAEVTKVRTARLYDHTALVRLRVPREIAAQVAGIRVQDAPEAWQTQALPLQGEEMVCRCERVDAQELRELLQEGTRDINEIKAVTRMGMGACGGKTCSGLLERLARDEGIRPEELTPGVRRPLFLEAPLSAFAGEERDG